MVLTLGISSPSFSFRIFLSSSVGQTYAIAPLLLWYDMSMGILFSAINLSTSLLTGALAMLLPSLFSRRSTDRFNGFRAISAHDSVGELAVDLVGTGWRGELGEFMAVLRSDFISLRGRYGRDFFWDINFDQ